MKKKGHRPEPLTKRRLSGYPYCPRCGLVLLKNEPSRKEWEKGCKADD